MDDKYMKILQDQKILIVEDEPDSLEVAVTLLEMFDIEVVTATNGKEGLAVAREELPAFIISDLSMPEMSGWEMLKNLQLERATSEIPVIALTAHAMEGDRTRAIAAGFHNYLTKPLRPETFINDLVKIVMDTPALSARIDEVEGNS